MAREREVRSKAGARAGRVRERSFEYAWLFPALMSVAVVAAVGLVLANLGVSTGPVGAALSARLTWGVSAMLFLVFFVFSIVACNTVMFRCGQMDDAMHTATWTTIIGVAAVVASLFSNDVYLGPDAMEQHLNATAFRLYGVRLIASAFDGLALWAAVLTIATSCVIIKNEVTDPEDLSRQLRGSKILMYTATALLVAGVAETGALHRWPAHELELSPAAEKEIEATATAISATVGTIFSLVLAATYLPLGIVLRQRAYRVIRPWERTETWLAIHGFALQPTQQLAKVFMVLSPLLAGGPVTQLISLLSHAGH